MQAAHAYTDIRKAKTYGVSVEGDVVVDFGKTAKFKNKIVKQLTGGVAYLVQAAGARIIEGTGRMLDAHTVEAVCADGSTETIEADDIVLATGSREMTIPGFETDGISVLNSTDMLDIKELPESITIIGGGVIGMEFLRELASNECSKYNVLTFDEPNIKDQFGSNFVQNMSFLKTKLYKILCFQKDFKNDIITKHRDKCHKNKNIIMQMLRKENNEFFISLMKAKLSDYEEIGEIIKKKLSLDEDDKKLKDFKDNIKSLINEIENNLKKARKKENKNIDYITIEELED